MGTNGRNGSDHDSLTPETRAQRDGFAISHADGCPGVHFPGVGIVWDERLADEQKHAFVDFLLARFQKNRPDLQ